MNKCISVSERGYTYTELRNVLVYVCVRQVYSEEISSALNDFTAVIDSHAAICAGIFTPNVDLKSASCLSL